jgi:hypothetical protein
MPAQTQILTRRGDAATWTSTNPTLGAGEIGYETDTGKFKIGTGAATWTSLGYFNQDPVTTKGDLYTFSTTDARLAVGNNGETLVADSSTATGLRWQGDYAAGVNKIINGDFGVWQRGTSFTSAAVQYTADRWRVTSGTSGTVAITRQTFTAGQTDVPNAIYFLQADFTASGTNPVIIEQRIEDVNTLGGQTATVSFYAKVNSGTKSVTPRIVQDFGSGGSSTVVTNLTAQTLTTSWQRFTITNTVPSVSGKTIGTGNYLRFDIIAAASDILTYSFANVQIEASSVASAFQTATGTIQGELAACQRYYFRNTVNSGQILSTIGTAGTTTATTNIIQPPVTMRVTPTVVDFATLHILDTQSAYAVSNLVIAVSSNPSYVQLTATTTGLTILRPNFIAGSATNSYIGIGAEL